MCMYAYVFIYAYTHLHTCTHWVSSRGVILSVSPGRCCATTNVGGTHGEKGWRRGRDGSIRGWPHPQARKEFCLARLLDLCWISSSGSKYGISL